MDVVGVCGSQIESVTDYGFCVHTNENSDTNRRTTPHQHQTASFVHGHTNKSGEHDCDCEWLTAMLPYIFDCKLFRKRVKYYLYVLYLKCILSLQQQHKLRQKKTKLFTTKSCQIGNGRTRICRPFAVFVELWTHSHQSSGAQERTQTGNAMATDQCFPWQSSARDDCCTYVCVMHIPHVLSVLRTFFATRKKNNTAELIISVIQFAAILPASKLRDNPNCTNKAPSSESDERRALVIFGGLAIGVLECFCCSAIWIWIPLGRLEIE